MRASLGLRTLPVLLLAVVSLACASPAGALELRVATWNLEHLDDTNGTGCVGRADDLAVNGRWAKVLSEGLGSHVCRMDLSLLTMAAFTDVLVAPACAPALSRGASLTDQRHISVTLPCLAGCR